MSKGNRKGGLAAICLGHSKFPVLAFDFHVFL